MAGPSKETKKKPQPMDPDLFMKVADVAEQNGVRPELAVAQMNQESARNPNAVSPKGAQGLFQLMPGTAKDLGVTDPFNQDQNINAGIKYFKQQLDTNKGDESLALAAYNAGPGAVKKYGGVPPYKETQDYVKRIMARAGALTPQDQSFIADTDTSYNQGVRPAPDVSARYDALKKNGSSPAAQYVAEPHPFQGTPQLTDVMQPTDKERNPFYEYVKQGNPVGQIPQMSAISLLSPEPPAPPVPDLPVGEGVPGAMLPTRMQQQPMDPNMFMAMMDKNDAVQKAEANKKPDEGLNFLERGVLGAYDTVRHPIDNAPLIGGTLGGIIGGAGGTAFGVGFGGVPGGIGGATLGGASGKAIQDLYNDFFGNDTPTKSETPDTSLNRAKDIGLAGLEQGAYEVAGHGISKALSPVKGMAKGVVRRALKAPIEALKATEAWRVGKGKTGAQNEIAETVLQEGLPVVEKSVEKAWERISTLGEKAQAKADASPLMADQKDVTQIARDALRTNGKATQSGTPQDTMRSYEQVIKDFMEHPNYQTTTQVPKQVTSMVPTQVATGVQNAGGQNVMQTVMKPQTKTVMQTVAGRKPIPVGELNKLQKGTYAGLRGKYGPQGKPGEADALIDLARGMKDQISQVPGIAPLKARQGKLIPAAIALDSAANRHGRNNVLSLTNLGLGTTGLLGSDYADDRSPLEIAALIALMKDPRVMTRLAVAGYKGARLFDAPLKVAGKTATQMLRFNNADLEDDSEEATVRKALDNIVRKRR